jgi:hypothetical protein
MQMKNITRMAVNSVLVASLYFGITASVAAVPPTIINFDDRPGGPSTRDFGDPIAPQFIIDDEYSSLGVLFSSGGGGAHLSAPSNPVSSPNVVSATAPGPVSGVGNPVFVEFSIGGVDAITDFVSLALTDSSRVGTTVSAFDVNGRLIESQVGGPSTVFQITNVGIHLVRIDGIFAFDDFAYSELTPIPEPGAAKLTIVGAIGLIFLRRGTKFESLSQQ